MAEDFFLKRSKTSETTPIDSFGDYDHKNEDDLASCGLAESSKSTFDNRNDNFFERMKSALESNDRDVNPVSTVSRLLEAHFSSREISFLLAKSVVSSLIKEAKDGIKGNNN